MEQKGKEQLLLGIWRTKELQKPRLQILPVSTMQGKERERMTNILLAIIALLLVSIWQQLKEINERRKGDMDGEKEKKGNAEFGNRK